MGKESFTSIDGMMNCPIVFYKINGKIYMK